MSHCSSRIFTCSGLLELTEGPFPSISGAADTPERSPDGSDESCVQESYHRLELFTRDFSNPDWLFERAVSVNIFIQRPPGGAVTRGLGAEHH